MTNTELVACIRKRLKGMPYPWWNYFHVSDMAEIADRLETLDGALSLAAQRIVVQSEMLSERAEKTALTN